MDEKFKELLDSEYSWPDYYAFKFITKIEQKDALVELLAMDDYSEQASRQGNYISITYRKLIHSADEVVAIYIKAKTVPGVMTL